MDSKEFSKYIKIAEDLLSDVKLYDGVSHHTVDSFHFVLANKCYKAAFFALKHMLDYLEVFYDDVRLKLVLHRSLIQRYERLVQYVLNHPYTDWSDLGTFF